MLLAGQFNAFPRVACARSGLPGVGSLLDSTSGSAGSNGRDTPPESEVRNHLEHIIASPDFEASARRRKLLRYLVEETLAGRGDKLKGYAIAISVFERDKTFDSQSDPVVRLEARRLRRDLDSYYMGAGNGDPVRIHVPKGSYVAHFETHDTVEPVATNGHKEPTDHADPTTASGQGRGADNPGKDQAGPGRSGLIVATLILVSLVVALVAYILAGKTPVEPGVTENRPVVVVLPFETLGSTPNSQHLASGLNQELIGNLMRFPGFRLYTTPANGGNDQYPRPGEEPDAAYVISGIVQDEADAIRVLVKLQNAATGQVLWSGSYSQPLHPAAMIKAQLELAGKIAAEVGAPYGIVNSDLEKQHQNPLVSNMQSYICVLRAYQYRRDFFPQEYAPVRACLEEAVKRDPGYSESWAMLGWIHLDAGRYEFGGAGTTQDEYQKALEAASRALQLEPDNLLALKAMSSIQHYLGHFDESERLGRRALALNPYDPDTLAQLGWRLAARGNFEEGIPFLKKAIERTVTPPGWYFHLIAIDLYLKGDYGQMREVTAHFSKTGGVNDVLLSIACSSLGDRECTREALARVSEFKPLARDPAAYFRRHGATDEITGALANGLAKARRFADQAEIAGE